MSQNVKIASEKVDNLPEYINGYFRQSILIFLTEKYCIIVRVKSCNLLDYDTQRLEKSQEKKKVKIRQKKDNAWKRPKKRQKKTKGLRKKNMTD